MKLPVIDIERTSLNLKAIRTNNNVRVSDLQKLFNMENPQSIYNWENPKMKNLPRIDNLVALAKFYKLQIDDLIVIKEESSDKIFISEPFQCYGISEETRAFILNNTSPVLLKAIFHFYETNV